MFPPPAGAKRWSDARESSDAGDSPESSGDRRDARTRVKLREAELNLGRYRDALVPHVKAAVEKAIGDRLSDPAALWLMPDIDPLALLDDDLALNSEKLDAAVKNVKERLPSLARRFAGSADGGARHSDGGTDATWAGVIGR